MLRLLLAGTVVSLSLATQALGAPAGPMLMVIHQKVASYAKWRPAYDAHKAARDQAGLSNCQVRSSTADPNDVFVACQMADLAKGKAFMTSKSLADAMKKAGVVGKPEFFLLGPPQ